jgi:hypothetical protein
VPSDTLSASKEDWVVGAMAPPLVGSIMTFSSLGGGVGVAVLLLSRRDFEGLVSGSTRRALDGDRKLQQNFGKY